MFTGIVEELGEIVSIKEDKGNKTFTLRCPFTEELKVDQSLAHNGVCLTVEAIEGNQYTVTAIEETLHRTNISDWKIGDKVNLERCMPATGRFDGHIVQGHVDTVATCTSKQEKDGSWEFVFSYEDKKYITVEKGSITINGVSLTVVSSGEDTFSVHIIPYTYNHTVFCTLYEGDTVNLEFDIVGKYIERLISRK